MGLVSLFTSCVDGDYYDLYDDEEEILSPRSKKGKDTGDENMFPLMNDGCSEYNGWFKDECAAFCYAEITGCSRFTARMAMIVATYYGFTPQSYTNYFEGVKDGKPGKKPSVDSFKTALGMSTKSFDEIAAQLKNGSIDLSSLCMVTDGNTHVSRVIGYSSATNQLGGTCYSFDVVDQIGVHCQYEYIYLCVNSNGDIDTSPLLNCFVGY